MIKPIENGFILNTKKTTYIIGIKNDWLLHLYYGAKIQVDNLDFLYQKFDNGRGNAVIANNMMPQYVNFEISTVGLGDYREPMFAFDTCLGYTCNLKYQDFEILNKDDSLLIPQSYNENQVLKLRLLDEALKIEVILYYKIFYECDVISKYVQIKNLSTNQYIIDRAMSSQLDFDSSEFEMLTFEGAWANERHLKVKPVESGIYINDSKCGASSNNRNPLVILKRHNTNQHNGECYGSNIVYSGNHKTIIEATTDKRMRVLAGVSDYATRITLDDVYLTKEVVLTYSNEGLNGLSQNYHQFVNEHIIRGNWKYKERPIVINNWEATYFNFDEGKLLKLARCAKQVGIELFVLDDGWFGHRDNDTSSLGDYSVNRKKLPKGIKHLAEKINDLGLDFGIWVEPEMISVDSDLYKAHPDWSVAVPNRELNFSRNQLVLDLTNPNVQDYLIESLNDLLNSANIKYVKWDYNRNISDMYSKTLINQGEFFVKYMDGLYRVFENVNRKFPDVLFEGCAGGGNRFDLGILCYFQQIWTSDDTDYLERLSIQSGTSYGYPPSTISNHVSDVPNHQTLRISPLASRFNLACFGVLGYELDLCALSKRDLFEIQKQVLQYKQARRVFQYGKFYRQEEDAQKVIFLSVLDNAIAGVFQKLVHPNQQEDTLKINGLEDNVKYKVESDTQVLNAKIFGGLINMISPIKLKIGGTVHKLVCKYYKLKQTQESYIVYGDALKNAGIKLHGQFLGTGFNNNVRVIVDFGSNLYYIRKVNSK